MGFEKGNKYGGRKKGAKNRLTNDVRQCFHRVFSEMGENQKGKDGKPKSGHEAFLDWGRENQTEFYRLYAKLISTTLELGEDILENFVDELIFEEEQHKLIEGNAKAIDVTNTKPK